MMSFVAANKRTSHGKIEDLSDPENSDRACRA